MFAGSRYRPAGVDPAERKRKARALALALVVHAIVVLVLLRQQVFVPMRERPGLATFDIAAPPAPKPAEKPQMRKAEQAQPAVAQPRPRPPDPPVETPPDELPFLQLSRADFASSNIGAMPSRKATSGGPSAGAAAVAGPGEGPGGRQLFAADWYRRPTSAELAGYLPANAPRAGWGMIACRTVERYEVDSCRVLGEFPLGSGFARAVRQAAWQFRVIPPSVDGTPMVGAWVRIRIEYREGQVTED